MVFVSDASALNYTQATEYFQLDAGRQFSGEHALFRRLFQSLIATVHQ
jgi:hypothetical protein